ncbi:MAG TPA: FAD-linked oxidase C-terminal domain-containing protein [Candidatus Dormibacteraeota bacterium]|nr:FAD-linked oxidase C-terminal domain-containing protein [Candidatus Dormibacteraeota bacterium]
MEARVVARLRAAVGGEAVLTEPAEVRAYECDGLTGHRAVPAAVVLPLTTEETAAAVRILHEEHIPFVPRGSGTGLSGGAVAITNGVVICLARMRSVLSVDIANERATVQPGVTNLAVSEAVAQHGYFYAPDPSSGSVCSIGGNVAENSGGAHCLKYGFTLHHVCGVTMVCAGGEVVRLGGSVPDAPGYDLLGVVVGSEGTLGIVTEVVLRLVPRPPACVTTIAAFDSMEAAGAAVSAIVAEGIVPAAVEMMDRLTIQAAEAAVRAGYPDCEALLLVEIDGPEAECRTVLAAVDRICAAAGGTGTRVATTAAERALLWRGRRAAFAAMGRVSPDYYVQDGVIPRTRLGPVLRGIRELELEFGLRVGNVFHAGDGNLHPLVCYDGSVPGESEKALELAGRILDLCLAEGGSITGEHGVGMDKACHMPRMFSEGALATMERVRAAFDPLGLCNPAKLLPTPRLCGEVPGPYRAHPIETAGLAERM